MAREIKKTEKDIAVLEKKLAAPGFAERAPVEVVEEARASLRSLRERLALLEQARQLAEEL
ncbi:MAG: hypothetical protein HY744_22535 [Deltaproteobacteria bacterium]|nr:hypothetical protein [Deltaproteobacteria bacterium]